MLKSLARKLEGRKVVVRPLKKGSQFDHDYIKNVSCFYTNGRNIKNKLAKLKSHQSRKT